MTDAELLQSCIKASGLSAQRFARRILIRDPRTVRRWLAGDDMPRVVRVYLTELHTTLNGTGPPA